MGKEEIRQGEAQADRIRVREGAEKVFHALNEASAARIQKYGLPMPQNHADVRSGLAAAHEKELRRTYEDAFHRLHNATYYKGWVDMEIIKQQVQEVEKAIKYIEKKVSR